MKETRLKLILGTFGLLGAVLVFVCGRIAIVNGEAYTISAVAQREAIVPIRQNRGIIYDRRGIPLVEARAEPLYLDRRGEPSREGTISVPAIPVRYSEDAVASHLIGYVDGDGVGVCGVEKAWERILGSAGHSTARVIRAADGTILTALGTDISGEESGSVTLTLDSHIQKAAEDTLAQRGVKGAVVVLDTATSDLLAMASSPDYNPATPQAYLTSEEGELVNRCLMPYNAGSIFKIVTLATVAQRNLLRSEYTCTGCSEYGEHSFLCNNPAGHGTLPWQHAFALSCNCAFYGMGRSAGAPAIRQTARDFGFGSTLIEDMEEIGESPGNMPPPCNETDAFNYAIGQGRILVTPLQVANMVCIVANDGIRHRVDTVLSVSTAPDTKPLHLPSDYSVRVISRDVARLIRECMELAVDEGTARCLADNRARIAGKTGTAETGWQVGERTMVHGWFCGYFPRDNPRYAMAVLVEDGGSGARSAAPIFGEIAEKIIKFYPIG